MFRPNKFWKFRVAKKKDQVTDHYKPASVKNSKFFSCLRRVNLGIGNETISGRSAVFLKISSRQMCDTVGGRIFYETVAWSVYDYLTYITQIGWKQKMGGSSKKMHFRLKFVIFDQNAQTSFHSDQGNMKKDDKRLKNVFSWLKNTFFDEKSSI